MKKISGFKITSPGEFLTNASQLENYSEYHRLHYKNNQIVIETAYGYFWVEKTLTSSYSDEFFETENAARDDLKIFIDSNR